MNQGGVIQCWYTISNKDPKPRPPERGHGAGKASRDAGGGAWLQLCPVLQLGSCNRLGLFGVLPYVHGVCQRTHSVLVVTH